MWNVKLEWCSVSQLLCWHRVTNDNGITQKIMSLSHLLPSRSTLIPPPPSSRVDFQLLIYPFIVVSFNPNIFYLASFQQLGRQHQSQHNFYFLPRVCVHYFYPLARQRPCVIVLGEVSQLAGKLNHCLSILHSFAAPHKHKWADSGKWKSLDHVFLSICSTCAKCCRRPSLITPFFSTWHMCRALMAWHPTVCEMETQKIAHFRAWTC